MRTRKDCGYSFEVGESYLVFASPDADGRYVVSGCSGTRGLDEEDNELRWLRQNASGTECPPPVQVLPHERVDGCDQTAEATKSRTT